MAESVLTKLTSSRRCWGGGGGWERRSNHRVELPQAFSALVIGSLLRHLLDLQRRRCSKVGCDHTARIRPSPWPLLCLTSSVACAPGAASAGDTHDRGPAVRQKVGTNSPSRLSGPSLLQLGPVVLTEVLVARLTGAPSLDSATSRVPRTDGPVDMLTGHPDARATRDGTEGPCTSKPCRLSSCCRCSPASFRSCRSPASRSSTCEAAARGFCWTSDISAPWPCT